MRGRQSVIVLAKACAIVGVALALYGTIMDHTPTFRAGILTALLASGTAIELGSRAHLELLMTHQEAAARLTMQERQRYTEIGYRAGRLDALTREAHEPAGNAQILKLPNAHLLHQMRRDGSA